MKKVGFGECKYLAQGIHRGKWEPGGLAQSLLSAPLHIWPAENWGADNFSVSLALGGWPCVLG